MFITEANPVPLTPGLKSDDALIKFAAVLQSRGQCERARLILMGVVTPEQFRKSPPAPVIETSDVYRAMERQEAKERRLRDEAKKSKEDWTDAFQE